MDNLEAKAMQTSTFGLRNRTTENSSDPWNVKRQSFFDAHRLGEIVRGLVFSSVLWDFWLLESIPYTRWCLEFVEARRALGLGCGPVLIVRAQAYAGETCIGSESGE